MRILVQILICLHMALPLLSFAQSVTPQIAKDPTAYSLRTYAFMLGVSVLGGLVSFYAKVRRGEASALSVMHLIGEICTSAFAGLLTFWLCEWANLPQILTAPLVGIAGHLGAKAIVMLEDAAKKRIEGKGL